MIIPYTVRSMNEAFKWFSEHDMDRLQVLVEEVVLENENLISDYFGFGHERSQEEAIMNQTHLTHFVIKDIQRRLNVNQLLAWSLYWHLALNGRTKRKEDNDVFGDGHQDMST